MTRISAHGEGETWVYQFPEEDWRVAVRRIFFDVKRGVLPEHAASGLLMLIAEANDDD
jgi:hypothetical protein